jgi:5'-3' exonuclease
LYILPPKSSELLPIGFRKIFEDERNFPTTFEIDMEGKEYDHEAIVKIEMPDILETEKKYSYVANSLIRPYPRNGCRGSFNF